MKLITIFLLTIITVVFVWAVSPLIRIDDIPRNMPIEELAKEFYGSWSYIALRAIEVANSKIYFNEGDTAFIPAVFNFQNIQVATDIYSIAEICEMYKISEWKLRELKPEMFP